MGKTNYNYDKNVWNSFSEKLCLNETNDVSITMENFCHQKCLFLIRHLNKYWILFGFFFFVIYDGCGVESTTSVALCDAKINLQPSVRKHFFYKNRKKEHNSNSGGNGCMGKKCEHKKTRTVSVMPDFQASENQVVNQSLVLIV